jgi:tripeptide aminopeptidase
VRRAAEVQRRRLHATFAELCRIPSPTGQERACADHVTEELRQLDLEVSEDAGFPGSGAGNLLARVPPHGCEHSILLCTHLDTVPLGAEVEPVLRDGFWENDNDGILGADNKAAVAVAIELTRWLTGRAGGEDGEAAPVPERHAGLELLFTVAEETGLEGAKAFDASRLRSRFGYVLDHATPIGEIIVAAPTHYRLQADFSGRAAHAGLCPESGRSAIVAAARAIAAMPLGRLDEQTTANVGVVSGGSATNVVAERCRVRAEVRSLDEDHAGEILTALIDHCHEGAGAAECDVDVSSERLFSAYRVRPRDPVLLLAERALQRSGYTPRHVTTGGGADANALQAGGFPCINLANGTERAHEPTERVSQVALEDMLEVMLAVVELGAQAAA